MPAVTCNSIDNIHWNAVSADSFILGANVHVWRLRISSNTALINHFEAVLDAGEQKRASSYHHDKDKTRFILCRGALRFLLGRYMGREAADIKFVLGKNYKPFVQTTGEHEFHYNVTHSGDWILIAIANTPVGIDTEYIDADFSFTEVLPVCFKKDEINFIQKAKEPIPAFYLLWTRKEALTKATTKGIDNDLSFIPCLEGDHTVAASITGSAENWRVSSFETDKQYIASIAYNPVLSNILFMEAKDYFDELRQK